MSSTEAGQTSAGRGLALAILIVGAVIVLAVAVAGLPWPAGLAVIGGTVMVGAGAAGFTRRGGA